MQSVPVSFSLLEGNSYEIGKMQGEHVKRVLGNLRLMLVKESPVDTPGMGKK
ncbi:hypothetical protein ACLM5H_16105 [Fredinandcohnia humi]